MRGDRDFREFYAQLRREDQAYAGDFHGYLVRARQSAHSRKPGWILLSAAVALMILVVALVVPRAPHRIAGAPEMLLTEWKSPTDFLLQLPGQEVLRSVPRFVDWPAAAEIHLQTVTGNENKVREKKPKEDVP
jgi:hypothetical protein